MAKYIAIDAETLQRILANIDCPADTLAEAKTYAAEIASEGNTAVIIEVLETYEAQDQPSAEIYNGVRAGIDFPYTLNAAR